MAQIKTAQELFAGLFTEATPEGLPQGASPRAINVDYLVGSVGPRPGKQSAFTFPESFFDSAASFTQSVGEGAPWSGGSVTLNQGGSGCNPSFVSMFFGSALASGNSITYTGGPGFDNTGFPCVIVYPFISISAIPPAVNGGQGWITSIADNAGGVWSELQPPTTFSGSFGSPDPAEIINYQFWVGVFANGIPASFNLTLTLHTAIAAMSQFLTPNASASLFTHVTGFNQFAFHKVSPTLIPANGGANITTAGNAVIVSTANIFNLGKIIPPGTSLLYTGAGSPSVSAAVYSAGGSIVSPSGTYTPVWSYGGSSVPSPFQDTVLSTVALTPQNCPCPLVGLKFDANTQYVATYVSPAYSQTDGHQGYLAIIENDNVSGSNPPPVSIVTSAGDTYNLIGSSSSTKCANYIYYCTHLNGNAVVHMTITFSGAIDGGRAAILYELAGTAHDNTTSKSENGFVVLDTTNPVNFTHALALAGGRTEPQVRQAPPFLELDDIFNGNVGSLSYNLLLNQASSFVSIGGNNTSLYQSIFDTTACGASTGPMSQTLQASNFNLNIPLNIPQPGPVASGCGSTFTFVNPPPTLPVLGVEIELTGSQTDLSEDAELLVQLQLPDGTLSPEIKTAQLPLTPGTVTLGSPTDLWGFTAEELNAAILNDPNFMVNIVAQAPGGEIVTFTVTVEVLVAFSVPDPPPNINYLKSFAQTGGELTSLVLGSNGTMYIEDAINNPDVLTPLFTRIFPDSFAQSCTLDDREYIAISNLKNGTDIPRVYSPPNFDRLSQVGPGAPPSANGSNVGGTIPIASITQPSIKSDPENPGHISGFLWSAGPGSTQPGNVLTVYWGRSTPPGPSANNDPDLVVGAGVTIAGADTANPNNQFVGQLIDGNYIITSVGEGIPPGAQFGRWYFTVQVPVSQIVNQADHIEANAPDGTYQVTTATLTAASPIPNMQIGSTMQIAGTGGSPPAGYDGSWLVTDSANAAQLQITNTSLTGNIATYSYTIISGATPAVGSVVTVGETLNGNGIFNVSNATITSTSPGIFSISLSSPDIPSAPESGTGIVAGTIFKFEPGKPVGNKIGVGTVVVAGIFAFGQRKLCYSFLTRNGFLTQPSPIATVDIILGSTGIAVSHLSPGPENVVARVIHFTGANGGQFYNIPDPVFVTDPITGQKITNDSTWVMDNTTTNVVLSFSDTVLLAADEIDIQGNNLFACYELGSCTALIPYSGAQRLAAIGEQNKVFNFRNHSFDGGVGGGGLSQTYPLGWTVDPVNGAGGSVVISPIFGNAFQIQNSTGAPQAVYGMILQPAYKDEFLVDIIQASTTYSVRVTAAALAPIASGNLVIDLFSPVLNQALGTFTLALNLLTPTMQLFSGTLLTTMLAPVPKDLVLRIYAAQIPNGAVVTLDRIEPFPTEAPNLDTQVIFSYAQNFEAFDRITGVIKPAQNSQPIRSCFVEFDTFYMGKTNSLFSTTDNGTTEPVVAGGGWGVKTISQSVGSTSVYGITAAIDQPNSGEDWGVLAGRAGLYIYDGGEPVKLSEEIQSIWNRINWKYEHTLWTLNDIINRRILVGVPLATFWFDAMGNVQRGTWLPEGVIPDDPAPTTPNVILELNYKQLNTAGALSSSVGVHRSYSGKILDSEMTRKWALWTIKAPAAAFLTRSDNTAPVFLGNSDNIGKIFQLIEGFLEDDGSPFSERYITSPFLPRQEAQAAQVGVLRYGFDSMTLIIDGAGSFGVKVHNNYVDGAGTRQLLPDLTFPVATYGDAEVPLDEEANRIFVEFISQCVNSAYILSGMTMLMSTSGFAPYSGRNG